MTFKTCTNPVLYACSIFFILQSFAKAQNSPAPESQNNPSKEPPVKLFEPYPPKPSAEAPPGWEIHILEGSVIENVTVLRNKREIKVTVPAYELVPIAVKGESFIYTKDPGFDPTQGTAQTNTIGALLTQYLENITTLQSKLDNTIQELEATLKNNPPPKKEAPGSATSPKASEASQPGSNTSTPAIAPTSITPKDAKTEPTPTPSPAR